MLHVSRDQAAIRLPILAAVINDEHPVLTDLFLHRYTLRALAPLPISIPRLVKRTPRPQTIRARLASDLGKDDDFEPIILESLNSGDKPAQVDRLLHIAIGPRLVTHFNVALVG